MRRGILLIIVLFLFISPEAYGQTTATGRKALIPDISLIGSVTGAYFRDDPSGDQGENPARTGFNLQGLEMAVQSVVDPYVRGDCFLLFHEEGVEIEEAALTTLGLPANLQFRGGKMLARFGRQNTHHLEQLDFIDQSLVNRYFFGPEGFSELGAELSALLPLHWFSEISLEMLQGENTGNFDGTRKEDFVYLSHWKNGFDLTDNLAGQIGLSSVSGFNDTTDGNRTEIYGADFYFRWKPNERRGLKWQTEYLLRRRETVASTQVEGGLYSQLVGRFSRRWQSGLRAERIGWPLEEVSRWAFSPQITFLASEFFHLRAQYNYILVRGDLRDQHEAFLQVQFNMGPHGAHLF